MHRAWIPVAAALLAATAAVAPAPSAAAGSGTVADAPAATLGLHQAMARAREQALEVAAARSRQEAAEARVRQARAHRLPVLSLQEVWLRTDAPAEAFALTLNQERFSFQDFVAGDPNHPEAVDNAKTRLEATVPLYTGGEIATRIEQARLAAQAAGLATDRAGDAAALAAADAWVRLAQAREQVALLEASLATVEAHVELARAYVGQGMLVTSELLRAEVESARLADLLVEARGHARVAQSNLAFQMGEPLDTAWELATLPQPMELAPGIEPWLAAAGERSDVAAARHQVEAARLEARVRRAARKPRVALSLRYDLDDTLPFGTHGDSTAVMAMAGIDLWAGGRHRAAIDAAEADADAADSDLARFLRGVALQVETAWSAALTARERHATAEAAVASARETERILGERFRQGVAKTLDLVDASTARRDAETRELVARAEAHRAALALAFEAGRDPETLIPPSEPAAADRPDTPVGQESSDVP